MQPGMLTALIAFIFAAVVGFAIWWINPRPLPEVVICQSVVPGIKQVGLKFNRSRDGGIAVDVGGTVTGATATPEALQTFFKCLQQYNKATSVTIVRGVNLDLEPIGQVAEHWKSDDDLRLKLMPGGNWSILNNLRIGPAIGRKQDVIRSWCSTAQAGRCVKCSPENPSDATQYVEIELRLNPPVEKQQLRGVWAGAAPGGKLEAWQLVEAGKRFVYACRS